MFWRTSNYMYTTSGGQYQSTETPLQFYRSADQKRLRTSDLQHHSLSFQILNSLNSHYASRTMKQYQGNTTRNYLLNCNEHNCACLMEKLRVQITCILKSEEHVERVGLTFRPFRRYTKWNGLDCLTAQRLLQAGT
jgi:hypothetical protein